MIFSTIMEHETMQAWRLHRFGLDGVKLGSVAVPIPGPKEVLMRVSAVALNFRDKAIIDGVYDPDILAGGPLILVSDAVGSVVQTGSEVTQVKTGDRVTSHLYSQWVDGSPRDTERDFMFGGPLPGGLGEYMVLHENGVVPAPSYLSDEEAATLPTAALTAWSALVDFVPRQAGDTVLVQGTGGVSLFATQLAAAMGLRVIVTTSSDEKGQKALALGAAHVINYVQTPAWEDAVLELTGGRGVDQVLEVVGGDKSIDQSIKATRVDGLVSLIGFLDHPAARISLIPVLYRRTRLQGMTVGPRTSFEAMNAFLDRHRIRPVIERVYAFEDALDAFRHLGRGACGKIVVSQPE